MSITLILPVQAIVQAPTGAEADGMRYIVGASPTGIFTGHSNNIAEMVEGIWLFAVPVEGLEVQVLSEHVDYAYAAINGWRSTFQSTPERFGAVGDGATDDTDALTSLCNVINSGAIRVINFAPSHIYLCAPLPAITQSGVTLRGNGAIILAKADSWSNVGDGSTHFQFGPGGHDAKLSDLVFDGNQWNFASAPGTGRVLQFNGANSPLLQNVTVCASANQGARFSGVDKAQVQDCHFDGNAGIGVEHFGSTNHKWSGTSRDNNGHGFQETYASTTRAAFGDAWRFNCHGNVCIGGSASFNGRDGSNQNQGSHDNYYIGERANGNGDGGFTAANDSTDETNPYDGKSPYRNNYLSCEAIANWASGFAAYCAVTGYRVSGRYANNFQLAGTEVYSTSAIAGIFFAGGTTDTVVDADVYDDRQLRLVTAVGGSGGARVLSANGWISKWSILYPALTFFDASMAFQGYGKIIENSAGSVTIQSAVHNGVALDSIVAGWYVGQCLQAIGVMADNSSQIDVSARGFGHRSGPSEFMGNLVVGGYFASGADIVNIVNGSVDPAEMLVNPTFDIDNSGWITTNATISSETDTARSIKAMKIAGGGGGGYVEGALNGGVVARSRNNFVRWEADVYSDVPQINTMLFYTAMGTDAHYAKADHPGGGWKRLRVSQFIGPSITGFPSVRFGIGSGAVIYVDNCIMRTVSVPETNSAYARSPILDDADVYPVIPS